ncbi:unnamed protein product [Rotaria sordida]|uniref:Uncharacterized protein n=1 Tax=Rotaria sordida TaxID=392033 RepID=A0A819W9C4_9BILA|nr:unnamed protein product [Rotaria sordida]
MPGFLHKEKQFSAKEANRTRFMTKTRWNCKTISNESTKEKLTSEKTIHALIQNDLLVDASTSSHEIRCQNDVEL